MKTQILYTTIIVLSVISCKKPSPLHVAGYDVLKPEICHLPKDLREVSGLTYDSEINSFYAVNDEKGKIFSIDFEKCESKKLKNYHDDGDYEGLEKVGKHIFILESKGTLHKFNIEKEKITKVYNTPLGSHNDTEGLGYDPQSNRLIIACKANYNLSKKSKSNQLHSIYRFDIDKKELDDDPWMIIDDKALVEFYESVAQKPDLDMVFLKKRLKHFAPSAIAHNHTDDLFYILSTQGKLLVVMSREAKVKDIYLLDHSAYIQPEGISFNEKGDMFISNEGKSRKSNILMIRRSQINSKNQ